MTIWGSIKAFLNSQLGKEEFKSLDEMLVNGWKVRPSDYNIYYDVYSIPKISYNTLSNDSVKNTESGEIKIRKTYKAYGDGKIRVQSRGIINIYKNGTLIHSATNQSSDGNVNVDFEMGDVLTFVVSDYGYNPKKLIIYGEEYKDDYFI